MNKRQIALSDAGRRLSDDQLARVMGGLNTPLQRQTPTMAGPRLQTLPVHGHSKAHK